MPVLGDGGCIGRLEVADQQVTAAVIAKNPKPPGSGLRRESYLRDQADGIRGSRATAVGLP
jgi:hypothetical protein